LAADTKRLFDHGEVLDDNVFAIFKSHVFLLAFVSVWFLLRVKKKSGPRPDWSPFVLKMKISEEHPPPLSYASPPSSGGISPGSFSLLPLSLASEVIFVVFQLKFSQILR